MFEQRDGAAGRRWPGAVTLGALAFLLVACGRPDVVTVAPGGISSPGSSTCRPGQPGYAEPGQPGQPGKAGYAQPGQPGPSGQPGQAYAEPGEPGQPGEAYAESGQPGCSR